mmetsp:Transcript_18525/g.53413  ORF Transcript_18525/g.53413 Transcript_18525/m.53413 type:complete len:212 (-) Transcript_18525:295-930(-)
MKSLFAAFSLCLTSGRALSFQAVSRGYRHTAAFVSKTNVASHLFALNTGEFYGDEESELFDMGYQPQDRQCLPCPYPELNAENVVQLCMDNLLSNDEPRANAGLEVCFNFSSDQCRAALGGSLEKFIQYASNPTFGSMVGAKEWTKASVGPIIEGTNTRGAMQTVLVDVKPSNGRDRRFLWSLQRERRPPRQNCWLVHECIFVENSYLLTL